MDKTYQEDFYYLWLARLAKILSIDANHPKAHLTEATECFRAIEGSVILTKRLF